MTEASLRYEGWRVAAAGGVGVVFAVVPFVTFAVLLKPLAEAFSWSRETISIAYGSMTLAAALAAPFIGLVFDRFGSRWMSAVCLAVSGAGFASLYWLTPHLWHFYGVFTAIGLVTTGSSAVVYARAVSSWFDQRRGAALAVVIASAAVGGIIHPTAAAALIRLEGWRTGCLVLGCTSLAVGVPIVARYVRERAVPAADRRDTSGATVAEAARTRIFWILVTVVFGTTMMMNAVIVHLSALLTDRGITPGRAAIVVSALGAASLAGRLLTGLLIDRFPAPRVSFVLLAVAAAGTWLLAGAGSLAAGALAAVLIGFGTGGELDVVPYLLSRYFGLRSLSTLYGLNWTAFGTAGALGPVVMGRMFDTTGSYEATLTVMAATTLAAGALMLALPPVGPFQPLATRSAAR